MVTQEPLLNQLVSYLDSQRSRILDEPDRLHVLRFSRRDLEAARHAFYRMIQRGEEKLHRLCELLGHSISIRTSTYQE